VPVVVVRKQLFGLQGTACKHGAHVRAGMPTLVTGTLVPKNTRVARIKYLDFRFPFAFASRQSALLFFG
jgi:hypothetical protein